MANSAKRDSNGTWHIQFRYTDWTGVQRKSSRKGFKSKKEAEEWLSHFLAQQSSDPTIQFSDFWEIYKYIRASLLEAFGWSKYQSYLGSQSILFKIIMPATGLYPALTK